MDRISKQEAASLQFREPIFVENVDAIFRQDDKAQIAEAILGEYR